MQLRCNSKCRCRHFRIIVLWYLQKSRWNMYRELRFFFWETSSWKITRLLLSQFCIYYRKKTNYSFLTYIYYCIFINIILNLTAPQRNWHGIRYFHIDIRVKRELPAFSPLQIHIVIVFPASWARVKRAHINPIILGTSYRGDVSLYSRVAAFRNRFIRGIQPYSRGTKVIPSSLCSVSA
jgi:hypothetical protein